MKTNEMGKKSKSIVFKAADFKYPSKEELREIDKSIPELNTFLFPYLYELSSLLEGETMDNVRRNSSLYWWNLCLNNRIWSLNQAYTNALVNYNRGIPSESDNPAVNQSLNRIQFDFYAETYFYFYQTVKDSIAQIMNVFYNFGHEDNQVYFAEIIKKIPDTNVKSLLKNFSSSTKKISDIRHSFTHRFLVTHPDYRPYIRVTDNRKTFNTGSGREVKSEELKKFMQDSINDLSILLVGLRDYIK